MFDGMLDLEDLEALPDDGNRWEILDGAMVVTPPPSTSHQLVGFGLARRLHAAAMPLGLLVLPAPCAWRIGPGQVPEPDVIVARPETVTERAVTGPPVLVAEVLSPSGRNRDLFEKRRIYAEGGAEWYWIVDPAEPSLRVLRLEGGEFFDDAYVRGAEVFETDRPFPVVVVPSQLRD